MKTETEKSNKKALSPRKKKLFTILLVIALIAYAELMAVLIYHFVYSKEKQALVNSAIDLTFTEEFYSLRFKPHPYFLYVCNPDYKTDSGYQPHNSQGFRKPELPRSKAPDTLRIVTLGASTTYGIFNERAEGVWPAMVESILNHQSDFKVEVINLAVPSYTAYEVIGVMAMIVPTLTPDIVIFHLGGNDAYAACYPDEGGPDNRHFRHAWNFRSIPDSLKKMMRMSYLIRILGASYYFLQEGYFPGDLNDAIAWPMLPNDEVAELSANATGKYFKQNMSTLTALSHNIGVTPVFLTQPQNPMWDNPADPFFRGVALAHKNYNQITRGLADVPNTYVIDIYSQIRDPKYFIDALHVNPAGMQLKAQLIAQGLLPMINKLDS